ncbi:MAG: hypothetical protein GX565_01050 [Lentisphaerae bacterium]|nr:hypothetical protein [Lentisphaerota bacterium]
MTSVDRKYVKHSPTGQFVRLDNADAVYGAFCGIEDATPLSPEQAVLAEKNPEAIIEDFLGGLDMEADFGDGVELTDFEIVGFKVTFEELVPANQDIQIEVEEQ